ncbi:molybdopterin molybdotransferase MoeA [Galbibacter mesophilus]|uniref:molybdopterin molybdotransferase MoeA n=1 Tax=Galbibacter mesophilus TaxID=379069 RepID=UPI00191DF2B2|nr:molybdopterin molybdotransferase MoeA [Galbibacter mesophilus]MCM5661990.1 molybdopterin molybdotransferase MoeA [Galbibacter mesophilus]
MISFEEAYTMVMTNTFSFKEESVFLTNSLGRVLAEDIYADRDFPPFHRVTKDGIAIHSSALKNGQKTFPIEGIVAAGTEQIALKSAENCLEIMTGAVLPDNADTVIMYEEVSIENGKATLLSEVEKGQNIHKQGSDIEKGHIVIKQNTKITAAEIGVLAAVGKVQVKVKKLPEITLISTGNELVAVHEKPAPHQIRNSNMLSLHALLQKENIQAHHLHLDDEKNEIKNTLQELFTENDVLMLSGGVSKGKYDFIPEAMEELGVEKVFHRVQQRPGKPFWFGIHRATNTYIFSFPGNPVSTFANYHIYFKDWLNKSLQLNYSKGFIVLGEEMSNTTPLTLFLKVKVNEENEIRKAFLIKENGSGDLTSLVHTDGFIQLAPKKSGYQKGDVVPFVSTR